jgi:FtsP/CotA-like multicopper oxidase with cupredoxin domain
MCPASYRRTACAGVLALIIGGCGHDGPSETFTQPEEIRSVNGELRTTFTVSDTQVTIAGKSVRTTVYNGTYMPPLLRVKPGDTIYLNLNNQTGEPTNEHYHGLNVSPRINPDATVSDNILIQADPGTQVNYKIQIPATHNPGLYWYHAHLHGLAEKQVMGGLSGGLIVEGVLDPFPELKDIRERVMLLKDIQITPQGGLPDDIDPGGDTNRTVNGTIEPTLALGQGEIQFWRIANIGADLYYRLKIDGLVFEELARDGNRHNKLVQMEEILLPPGARSEVLIRGGQPGNYELRTLAFNTGPDGDSYVAAKLATIVTRGQQVAQIALPQVLPGVEDFRPLPLARRRTITFSEDTVSNTFFMDSGAGAAQFDANRVDSTIQAGTVEEWTINNASAELHVFHIHQTDFQVTEINGVAQDFAGHQDSINVPFQVDGAPPGQVKVLIDFRDPNIVGKFVYHCHILEHEDGGMMSIAEVLRPPDATAPLDLLALRNSSFDRSVIANTLGAFQSGSYCKVQRPGVAATAAALTLQRESRFRIERLQVRAQL